MLGRVLALSAIVGGAVGLSTSCTNDFGQFEPRAGSAAAGRDGSASNGGSSGADSGAGGSAPDAGSGGASGTGGTGGRGGSPGTGGLAVDGGDAGGASGTGGAAATGGGAGDSGTPADGGKCPVSLKLCGPNCVSPDDPATGCAGTSCAACSIPNATAICALGECAKGTCSPGFGDCDTSASTPGCERPIHDDIANCGGCERACSTTRVATRTCTGNACTSFCEPGFGNCSRPTTGIDNGCETDVTTNSQNCGGCGNNCGSQRSKVCVNGTCSCSGNARHCSPTNSTVNILCDASGVCSCSGVLCVPGETCTQNGGQCSCNNGAKCSAGQTCCQTPAGCFDLQTDAENCGGCGHACSPGFACVAGVCRCDSAGDCDAGTSGATSCDNGICSCGSTTCTAGQRCLVNGVCG